MSLLNVEFTVYKVDHYFYDELRSTKLFVSEVRAKHYVESLYLGMENLSLVWKETVNFIVAYEMDAKTGTETGYKFYITEAEVY